MRPDSMMLGNWRNTHLSLPAAAIDQDVHKYLLAANAAGVATSVNLLPYMSYPQADRNQGNCGDCWVWGSTATAEILMGVHGVKDALSVQYFNSAYTADFACCGGDLTTFASWYGSKRLFVPLSNTNGAFADANSDCSAGKSAMAASKISTTPNHAFSGLSPVSITTSGAGQATAIANIKNLLNQNQPVAYSYFLPTDAAWNDFFSFWDNQSESALWNADKYSGKAWNNGGGHLVTIVGYDDSSSTAANHYWIVLNSWGTQSNRPNGVFHLAQQMNYDSYFTDSGTKYDSHIFESMNITWPGNTALSIGTQPASVTVATGKPAIFKVVVSGGTQPYTYQWRKNGSAISGATSASYTITAVATNDAGSYDVVVKDSASGSVTSKAATLTVSSCTPACSGKVCGDDTCGGQCGNCSGSTTCNASGQCVAASGKVVINEVSTRGPTAAGDEMIELYNGTTSDVSLSGYKLYYRSAKTTSGSGTTLITFTSTAKIPAGKHFLLATSSFSGSVTPDATYSSALADAGGSVWLFKAAPTTFGKTDANFVDLVGWGTAVSANYEGASAAPVPGTGGKSIERTNGADTGNNGADFKVQATRTPQNTTSP